jgi:hypothetical protein
MNIDNMTLDDALKTIEEKYWSEDHVDPTLFFFGYDKPKKDDGKGK